MKQIYEEPMMITVVFGDEDIVTLSGGDKESGNNTGSFDDMFEP